MGLFAAITIYLVVAVLNMIYLKNFIGKNKGYKYLLSKLNQQYIILLGLSTLVLTVLSYLNWDDALGYMGRLKFTGQKSFLYSLTYILWIVITFLLIDVVILIHKKKSLPDNLKTNLYFFVSLFAILHFLIDRSVFEISEQIIMVIAAYFSFNFLVSYSKSKWINESDAFLATLGAVLLASFGKLGLELVIGLLLSSLVALYLYRKGKISKQSKLELLPYLMIGMFVAEIYGNNILQWYQSIVSIK